MGSVCGLGIIAAVSAYFFWFRPMQQEKKKKEQDEIGLTQVAANGAQATEKGDDFAFFNSEDRKLSETQQSPTELSSPIDTAELPSAVSAVSDIAEVPGDKGGFELHPESYPVELPGDHEYRSSDSIHSHR